MMKKYGLEIKVKILLTVALVIGLALIPQISPATDLKVLSGFPTTHLFTTGCIGIFDENLKEASGGTMELSVFGPDVAPTNEQFQPVQSGVFDILFTHSAYHLGSTAMGVATECMKGDPVLRRESGVIDAIDRHYNKLGMKLLAVFPLVEYNIVLSKPIGDRKPSLKGLKIRTAPSGAPMIQALGGAPVTLPPGEIYTALQKGVIDGFTLVAVGLADYKIHEVAKYLVRPKFGYISLALYMNLDKFNNLSEQERNWLVQAGIKSEKEAKAFFQEKHLQEVENLKSLGMEEIQLLPEDAARIDKLMSDTIWAVAEKKSGQDVKDLRKLALEKGLTQ